MSLPSEDGLRRVVITHVSPEVDGGRYAVKRVTGDAVVVEADIFLDGHDDLREHIGHRVEVEGELKDDVKDGEITTERKDNWTELTVKADGRTLKAKVPNTSIFPASRKDKERKSDILVRRVDVDRVRMLGATCN